MTLPSCKLLQQNTQNILYSRSGSSINHVLT